MWKILISKVLLLACFVHGGLEFGHKVVLYVNQFAVFAVIAWGYLIVFNSLSREKFATEHCLINMFKVVDE